MPKTNYRNFKNILLFSLFIFLLFTIYHLSFIISIHAAFNINQPGNGVVVAGIVDQHILGQRGFTDGFAFLSIDAELAGIPENLCFRAVDFVGQPIVEIELRFLSVKFDNMAKNFNQRLEQVGLAGAVFADKDLDKAIAVEAQVELPEVFVLADVNRFQVHCIFLYLRHHGIEEFCLLAGAGLDLLIQRVAESHKLVDFGNDTVLF